MSTDPDPIGARSTRNDLTTRYWAVTRRSLTPPDSGVELSGEALLAARAVVESAIVRYAQSLPDRIDTLEALMSIVNLSEVAVRLGRVGDPPRQPDDDRGRLGPEDLNTLVTEARWEVTFGDDAAEESWSPDQEGYEQACAVERWRAANGRQVLEAVGAEPGNPAEVGQEF